MVLLATKRPIRPPVAVSSLESPIEGLSSELPSSFGCIEHAPALFARQMAGTWAGFLSSEPGCFARVLGFAAGRVAFGSERGAWGCWCGVRECFSRL